MLDVSNLGLALEVIRTLRLQALVWDQYGSLSRVTSIGSILVLQISESHILNVSNKQWIKTQIDSWPNAYDTICDRLDTVKVINLSRLILYSEYYMFKYVHLILSKFMTDYRSLR